MSTHKQQHKNDVRMLYCCHFPILAKFPWNMVTYKYYRKFLSYTVLWEVQLLPLSITKIQLSMICAKKSSFTTTLSWNSSSDFASICEHWTYMFKLSLVHLVSRFSIKKWPLHATWFVMGCCSPLLNILLRYPTHRLYRIIRVSSFTSLKSVSKCSTRIPRLSVKPTKYMRLNWIDNRYQPIKEIKKQLSTCSQS